MQKRMRSLWIFFILGIYFGVIVADRKGSDEFNRLKMLIATDVLCRMKIQTKNLLKKRFYPELQKYLWRVAVLGDLLPHK